MPRVAPDAGLELMTPSLGPERRSRVGCFADWAPRPPKQLSVELPCSV